MRSKLLIAQHKHGFLCVCVIHQKRFSCYLAQISCFSLISFPNSLFFSVISTDFFPLLYKLGSAFPNPSAALNPCRLCALASRPHWSDTPKPWHHGAGEDTKTQMPASVSSQFKGHKSSSAYQTLGSKLWQILDGTAWVIQHRDATRCRDKRQALGKGQQQEMVPLKRAGIIPPQQTLCVSQIA